MLGEVMVLNDGDVGVNQSGAALQKFRPDRRIGCCFMRHGRETKKFVRFRLIYRREGPQLTAAVIQPRAPSHRS
jgi:hypothetical protein